MLAVFNQDYIVCTVHFLFGPF